jgi:hypothetical protein
VPALSINVGLSVGTPRAGLVPLGFDYNRCAPLGDQLGNAPFQVGTKQWRCEAGGIDIADAPQTQALPVFDNVTVCIGDVHIVEERV